MKRLSMLSLSIVAVALAGQARAHCEVPCGIYDDEARIKMIQEHAGTIEKAMKQIEELGQAKQPSYNQIVRWTVTKEQHADEVQHLVAQYFLTQRIKPDAKSYTKKLTTLHGMLIAAMKCKQTVDPAHVKKLRALTQQFADLYFAK